MVDVACPERHSISRAISLGTSNFLGIQSDPNRARFSELALTCAQKPFDVDDLKLDPISWMVEREKDTLTYSRHVFDPIYGNCPNYRVFRDIEELQIVLLFLLLRHCYILRS